MRLGWKRRLFFGIELADNLIRGALGQLKMDWMLLCKIVRGNERGDLEGYDRMNI